jgi:uncharacterized protein
MKFQPDQFGSSITGYGPGWLAVAGERLHHSLVLHSDGRRRPWGPARFEDLGAADFSPLAQDSPELVVFGSGERLRFPRPAWVRALIEAGVGVETMDTAAACRTYNILAGEGRRVVAALLVEPLATAPDALK